MERVESEIRDCQSRKPDKVNRFPHVVMIEDYLPGWFLLTRAMMALLSSTAKLVPANRHALQPSLVKGSSYVLNSIHLECGVRGFADRAYAVDNCGAGNSRSLKSSSQNVKWVLVEGFSIMVLSRRGHTVCYIGPMSAKRVC